MVVSARGRAVAHPRFEQKEAVMNEQQRDELIARLRGNIDEGGMSCDEAVDILVRDGEFSHAEAEKIIFGPSTRAGANAAYQHLFGPGGPGKVTVVRPE
jgi:hypothetical protein